MADKRRRVVIKLGSGILTRSTRDGLHVGQFRRFAAEVAAVIEAGTDCVLVTSGAVAAGMMALHLSERPGDLPSIQACAAIGQSRLMRLYGTLFSRHGLGVAQLLLTHQDIDSRTRYQNARNTLEQLFRFGNVVPIINENDSVAVEELKFGENDLLSAEVALLGRADLLILLTSVDGLLDDSGRVIECVTDIDAVSQFATKETGVYSMGGMVSKLEAARLAISAGVPVVVASGLRPGVLEQVLQGAAIGTRFSV